MQRRLRKVEEALGRLLHSCHAELEVALVLEELDDEVGRSRLGAVNMARQGSCKAKWDTLATPGAAAHHIGAAALSLFCTHDCVREAAVRSRRALGTSVSQKASEAGHVQKRHIAVGPFAGDARQPGRRPTRAAARISKVAWMPQEDLGQAEWLSTGRRLGTIGRCSQWWIGDWIRYGNARWGEKYAEAAQGHRLRREPA